MHSFKHMWHPHSGPSAVPFGVSHFKDARVSVHQDSLGEPILYAEVPWMTQNLLFSNGMHIVFHFRRSVLRFCFWLFYRWWIIDRVDMKEPRPKYFWGEIFIQWRDGRMNIGLLLMITKWKSLWDNSMSRTLTYWLWNKQRVLWLKGLLYWETVIIKYGLFSCVFQNPCCECGFLLRPRRLIFSRWIGELS